MRQPDSSPDLRERIALRLWRGAYMDQEAADADWNHEYMREHRQLCEEAADDALAALGLDDLDAAVERAAIAYHDHGPGVAWSEVATPDYKDAIRAKVRRILLAALKGTEHAA